MEKSKKVVITIWIDPDILKSLDKFAKKLKVSRSKLIHNILIGSYEEIKNENNPGNVKFTLALEKLIYKITNLIPGVKNKIVSVKPNSKGTSLSLRIDPDLIKDLDLLAKKINMSRSVLIENILEVSIRNLNSALLIPYITDLSILLLKISEHAQGIWKNSFKKSNEVIEKKNISLIEEKEDNNK